MVFSDTEGVHNAMLETMPENQYYRFNPVHAAFDCELDETSDSKLDAMQVPIPPHNLCYCGLV